eukprot:Tbor_TRINITY_DN4618_c0_g1::TRINITY_DN4618_c0_g1_i1::g.15033::m.15033
MVVHTVSVEDAARFTLSPDQCYGYGAVPYFAYEVKGMFIRFKVSSDPAVYAWARIVRAVTADDLMSEDPELNTTVADCEWKVRILEHPIYTWRNKKFEVFFLCEHPSFSQQEAELTFEAGSQGSALSLSIDTSQRCLRKRMTAMSSLVINLSQLSRQHLPTQEEVDSYCQQFDNSPVFGNISNSDGIGSQKGRPLKFVEIFLTPPKTHNSSHSNMSTAPASVDPTAAVLTAMLGERATGVLHRITGSIADGELALDVKECGLLWESHFLNSVVNRPLSNEDTELIISANSRMSNVVGNLAKRYAAKSKEAIARQAKLEKLLEAASPANDPASQSMLATGPMGYSTITEGHGPVHLFTVEEEGSIRNDEKAFYDYVMSEDRSRGLDALVELSSRNRIYNREILSRGDKMFDLKAKNGQTRVGNEGSGVLWTVDKKKRKTLCMMDHTVDKGKGSDSKAGAKEGGDGQSEKSLSKPWHDPEYIKAVQKRHAARDSLRAVFHDDKDMDEELIALANATADEMISSLSAPNPSHMLGSSSSSLLFSSMKRLRNSG